MKGRHSQWNAKETELGSRVSQRKRDQVKGTANENQNMAGMNQEQQGEVGELSTRSISAETDVSEITRWDCEIPLGHCKDSAPPPWKVESLCGVGR